MSIFIKATVHEVNVLTLATPSGHIKEDTVTSIPSVLSKINKDLVSN